MKRLMTAAIAVTVLALGVPAQAADLGVTPYKRYVKRTTVVRYEHWRDRCARLSHYCLYAYRGVVYHYPWHDPPPGYFSARRRHID